MLKKSVFFTALFSTMLLTACGNIESETSENPDQPDEENIEEVEPDQEIEDSSEALDEEATDDSAPKEESEATDSSAENHSSEQETDQVQEEEYSSEEEAIAAVEDYQELEDTNVDLGHGIEGFIEGAAGHQYVTWNEGNWYFELDFPSDPQYAVEGYEKGEDMAKTIVDYLEGNMLLPPDARGVVKIRAFADDPETLIQWQEGTTVYKMNGETPDPIDTLQIAVDVQNNR